MEAPTVRDEPSEPIVTRSHGMGVHRNVVIVLWRGETTLAGVKQLRQVMRDVTEEYPAGIGLIQVVEPNAPPPDTTARKAIAGLLSSQREHLMGSALVFEEDGFKMAAVRAIVSGISALARPGYPHVVFSNVLKAADWLSTLLPPTRGRWAYPGGIVQAVDDLRQRLDAKCGSLRPEWRAAATE